MTNGVELAVKPARKMPRQKPGRSFQAYGTPKVFLDAVKARFGIKHFDWDLAATKANAVDGLGSVRSYFGPDHFAAGCRNALSPDNDWKDVDDRIDNANLWLNPPFADIAPWVEKCAASAWWESEKSKRGPGAADGRRIFLLVPAAVGSNWFSMHVHKKALVLVLNGRITFDGCPPNPKTGKVDPYPKDCMLCVYGAKPGFDIWRWGGGEAK